MFWVGTPLIRLEDVLDMRMRLTSIEAAERLHDNQLSALRAELRALRSDACPLEHTYYVSRETSTIKEEDDGSPTLF